MLSDDVALAKFSQAQSFRACHSSCYTSFDSTIFRHALSCTPSHQITLLLLSLQATRDRSVTTWTKMSHIQGRHGYVLVDKAATAVQWWPHQRRAADATATFYSAKSRHLRHGTSLLSTQLQFWTCIITLAGKNDDGELCFLK